METLSFLETLPNQIPPVISTNNTYKLGDLAAIFMCETHEEVDDYTVEF